MFNSRMPVFESFCCFYASMLFCMCVSNRLDCRRRRRFFFVISQTDRQTDRDRDPLRRFRRTKTQNISSIALLSDNGRDASSETSDADRLLVLQGRSIEQQQRRDE